MRQKMIDGELIDFTAEEDAAADALEAENAAADAAKSTQVPAVVPAWKAYVALEKSGEMPRVKALLTDPSTPIEIRVAFEKMPDFYRQSASVVSVAQVLGWSDTFTDDLFRAADQVTTEVFLQE